MNKIVITDDFEKIISEINPQHTVLADELKIEHIKKIKDLAYITSENRRIILIAAEKYSITSQNALLKLLEEPPENIEFVLVSKSKYALLDTIKSRLVMQSRFYNIVKHSDKDIARITNNTILELLKEDLDKSEIKSLIYKILKEKNLNEEQMKILSDAVKMIELNIDKKAVLALIMLAVKEKV